jgi:hypothetical protein
MVADFNKPTTASPYTTFPAEVRELFAALAMMMEGVTADNIPTLAKRINATTRMLEQYNGTTWVDALLKAADSALLEGQNSAFYRDASNINAGTINTARLPAASTTAKGAVELATTTEAAGTSGSLVVTPAGLSAVFTAAAILEKLLTVDGAGSGLDADTLDGLQATAFAATSHQHAYSELTGKPTLGTAAPKDIGTADTNVPTVEIVKNLIPEVPSLMFSASSYFHAYDEKSQGVQGGSSVLGTNIRSLNTVVSNTITGASLSDPVITLPAGTYYISASAPTVSTDGSQASLRKVSDGTIIVSGHNAFSTSSAEVRSPVRGVFVLASETEVQLVQYTRKAIASQGLGVALNIAGYTERYSEVEIWKLA